MRARAAQLRHEVGRTWLAFFGTRAFSSSHQNKMRARHTAHSTPTFPVYSAAFLSPVELILGGGGGASKTGIKNKLVRHPVLEHVTATDLPYSAEALSCR